MTNQPIMNGIYGGSLSHWIGSDRGYDRYNRSLANRTEDLLDPSFLMDWKLILDENNMNKVGHPFTTPNAFITFLAKMRSMHCIPFRSLEGMAGLFSRITSIITVCYTSIFRRIRKNIPDLDHHDGKPVECAIDYT